MTAEEASAALALIVAGLAERWGTYVEGFNPDLVALPSGYKDSVVLVAERDSRIVGVGILQPIGPSSAQILRMSVAHDCRRQGVGTLVLEGLLRAASEQGLSQVTLETTASWVSAVEFYERSGFVRTEVRDGNQHFTLAKTAA